MKPVSTPGPREPAFSGVDILDRIKRVLGIKTDVEIAKRYGFSRLNIAAWRRRGSVPLALLAKAANEDGLSLDWMMLGRGNPRADGTGSAPDATMLRRAEIVQLLSTLSDIATGVAKGVPKAKLVPFERDLAALAARLRTGRSGGKGRLPARKGDK